MLELRMKEIQSMLNRAGYGMLTVNGIYDGSTRSAIIRFQRDNGLVPDGIIGPKTNAVIEDYLNGYYKYKVKKGDTIYNLGKERNIDYRYILEANQQIDPMNMQIGAVINIPYEISIVPTDMEYTHSMLVRNLISFRTLYSFTKIGNAGYSNLGKGLYYMKAGEGKNKVFYNSSHHGLEWITTPMLVKYMEDLFAQYVIDGEIAGVKAREIFKSSMMTFMPMVNPDGVSLVLEGLKKSNPNYMDLIKWNNESMDFSKTWQANNNGVDINHNYDALWKEYELLAEKEGYGNPGPTRYPGPNAVSEVETKSVVDLTRNNNFDMTLSFHTQGEVIYWQFNNIEVPFAKEIGEAFERVSGYRLIEEDGGLSSYSGYKDWFIKEYRRPGYTVEVGLGKNPLDISQFTDIYRSTVPLLAVSGTILDEYKMK